MLEKGSQLILTPWSRVLPEKLKCHRLLKKFPAFYGTRRFITIYTRARHLSLSWARLIQSMLPPHPTPCRSILILSSHLRLGLSSGLLPYIVCIFKDNYEEISKQRVILSSAVCKEILYNCISLLLVNILFVAFCSDCAECKWLGFFWCFVNTMNNYILHTHFQMFQNRCWYL
jgi:hypothetical protein